MRKFLFSRYLLAAPQIICYDDGDGTNGDDEAATAAAAAAEAEAAAAAKKKVTFTTEQQAELNRILAEDRRKNEEKSKKETQKTLKELEDLKKSKNLTEQEKSQLATRIEELNNSLLTKEELAKKEREKLEKTHQQTVQELTTARDTWQNRFITTQIHNAITGEAVVAGAFHPDDIIKIIGPTTQLTEEKDDAGHPTGEFVPMVKYKDVDEKGKPITLDLTVEQTLKRMSESARFKHLFKSPVAGGLGGQANNGKTGTADVTKMTPEQYREYRKKQGIGRKFGSTS